ncbi:MAG: polysaccharide deacetylase, partial [Reyranella sp.]
MELRTHDRYDYVPLRGRSDYSWPAGRRLAVYFALNLEHFSYGEGLGAELAPGGPHPDILNYAWRDYGNRVGAWYMLDAFDALRLPMAALVNSAMYDYAPALVAACRARGDEIVGHGRTNAERQGVLDEAGERTLIGEATARLAEAEGRPPEGWLGPWISHSHVTPDLLAEAGYR